MAWSSDFSDFYAHQNVPSYPVAMNFRGDVKDDDKLDTTCIRELFPGIPNVVISIVKYNNIIK